MTATALILAGPRQATRPGPHHTLSPQAWRAMAAALAADDGLRFQALWADATQVYALFTTPAPLLVSTLVESGWYAALSPVRPAAARFERAIADLWGHSAADAADTRPWLDHGAWPVLRPMTMRPLPNGGLPEAPEMHGVAGPTQYQSVEGPVRPLDDPARIVLTAQGDTIQRAEARLGYGHTGTLALMRGRRLDEAAPLAARLSGTATVAHSLAYARAAEAALDTPAPPRAEALRDVMCSLERIATRLHDRAAILRSAGHDPVPALDDRETLLRAAQSAFGHRLMMDVPLPGGLPRDIAPGGPEAITAALAALRPLAWPASLLRRAAGGQARLARITAATGADILAASASLAALPAGDFRAFLPNADGEGLGRAESARGTVWHWLRIGGGRIAEAFPCDPAWRIWPQVEAEAAATPIDDWPLLAASCGLSLAGMDL